MRRMAAAALLAATTLVPALAQAQDGHHGGWHGGGGYRGGGQPQTRPQPAQAPQARPQGDAGRGNWGGQLAPQPQVQAQVQAPPQPQFRPGGAGFGGRNRYGDGVATRPNGQPGQPYRVPDGNRGFGPDGRGYAGARPAGDRPIPGGQYRDPRGGYRAQQNYQGRPGFNGYGDGRGYDGRGYGGYRGGAFQANRNDLYRDHARFNDRSAWNRGWRSDNRYNYGDWRRSHYDLFRLPRYSAPYGYGYGYQRFGIGVLLDDVLFAQDYWIDDPYEYRLPPVYGPYRWVRYYDDALLVDIETGEVVDTVYGIFD